MAPVELTRRQELCEMTADGNDDSRETGVDAHHRTPFHSILFDGHDVRTDVVDREPPAYWTDLNLDRVVESIVADRAEYELEAFFNMRPTTIAGLTYRHEIFRDLDGTPLLEHVASFAQAMRGVRGDLAQVAELRYLHQKQWWFLHAAREYCEAVGRLARDLRRVDIRSGGFAAFREFVAAYVSSHEFTTLEKETKRLIDDLAAIEYTVLAKGLRVQVGVYESEHDYSNEVEATFERFKRQAANDYRVEIRNPRHMNHVEAQVLGMVAKLNPAAFSALDDYSDRHRDFVDQTIARFDREVQFYLAYLDYVSRIRSAGLSVCYPVLSESKEVGACNTFDIALAQNLIREHSPVVCNDFSIDDPERIVVVSGPNQGGKTTFARTVGQLHYLANLGLPVPGTSAHLFVFDDLFTHFEREEELENLRGKLQDDLMRVRDILEQATPNSIIILNEIFTSTTLADARVLGRKVLEQIIHLDLLCVCVTFVYELASLGPTTVSMVSTVDEDDPTIRTYKVVKQPADGQSYAAAIAAKYGLSYERLRRRLAS